MFYSPEPPASSLPGSGPIPEKSKADLRQTKTFRKIEQHLKVRRRNAAMDTGPIDPRMESYVDKDRAIAVVSGKRLFLSPVFPVFYTEETVSIGLKNKHRVGTSIP